MNCLEVPQGENEKKNNIWTNFKQKELCVLKNSARKTFVQASFWDLWEENITWLSWQGRCSGVIVCFVDISLLWQSTWFYWSNGFPSLLSGSLSRSLQTALYGHLSDHCKLLFLHKYIIYNTPHSSFSCCLSEVILHSTLVCLEAKPFSNSSSSGIWFLPLTLVLHELLLHLLSRALLVLLILLRKDIWELESLLLSL